MKRNTIVDRVLWGQASRAFIGSHHPPPVLLCTCSLRLLKPRIALRAAYPPPPPSLKHQELSLKVEKLSGENSRLTSELREMTGDLPEVTGDPSSRSSSPARPSPSSRGGGATAAAAAAADADADASGKRAGRGSTSDEVGTEGVAWGWDGWRSNILRVLSGGRPLASRCSLGGGGGLLPQRRGPRELEVAAAPERSAIVIGGRLPKGDGGPVLFCQGGWLEKVLPGLSAVTAGGDCRGGQGVNIFCVPRSADDRKKEGR